MNTMYDFYVNPNANLISLAHTIDNGQDPFETISATTLKRFQINILHQ